MTMSNHPATTEEEAAHEIERLQKENEKLHKAVTAATNDNGRLKFPESPR